MAKGITITNKTRWIAAVTGCVTAVVGMAVLSLLSPAVLGFLILGALLAGRFPRHGRDLLWFGAGVTTLWVIPFGFGILSLAPKGGTDVRLIAAVIAAILLVIWCDSALLTDAIGQRPTANDKRLILW